MIGRNNFELFSASRVRPCGKILAEMFADKPADESASGVPTSLRNGRDDKFGRSRQALVELYGDLYGLPVGRACSTPKAVPTETPADRS